MLPCDINKAFLIQLSIPLDLSLYGMNAKLKTRPTLASGNHLQQTQPRVP